MSELKNKINAELKEAMKLRDQHKVTTVRGLLAAVKQVEVDTRTEPTDDKVIQIIQKEIKMRKDALGFAIEQKREDLIEKNNSEIKILSAYLGEQLSAEKLETIIKAQIDSGVKNIGQIMGFLNANHKGCFDGKFASEIIKKLLA